MLAQVTCRSQIIILEPSKKTGLKLARALQSQGQAKTYILQVAQCMPAHSAVVSGAHCFGLPCRLPTVETGAAAPLEADCY